MSGLDYVRQGSIATLWIRVMSSAVQPAGGLSANQQVPEDVGEPSDSQAAAWRREELGGGGVEQTPLFPGWVALT